MEACRLFWRVACRPSPRASCQDRLPSASPPSYAIDRDGGGAELLARASAPEADAARVS